MVKKIILLIIVLQHIEANAQCIPQISFENPAVCPGGSDTLFILNSDWNRKTDYPSTNRSGPVAFGIGNKGYYGTGREIVTNNWLKDFWEFDPITNVWTQKADFGGIGRSMAVGFGIGNKGYLGTGRQDPNALSDFWEYNPSNNTWTKKADFPEKRAHAVGFSIGNLGYIGTGIPMDANPNKKDFWEYNPTNNAWTKKADVGNILRYNAVGFGIGNKGYIGFGQIGPAANMSKDFLEYDAALNTWTQKAQFPGIARSYPSGFAINNKGYIGLGLDSLGKRHNDFYEFDPILNSWNQKDDFHSTRYGANGFNIGNRGYIGGGFLVTSFNDLWEYDPIKTVTWSNGNTQKKNVITAPGIYSVTIERINGCRDSAKVEINSLASTVSATMDKTSICVGENAKLTLSSKGDEWVAKKEFPAIWRSGSMSFSIGSKGYLVSGRRGLIYYTEVWEYDTKTNAWSQKANFGGTGRRNGVGFNIGTKGYAGLGATGINTTLANFKDMWEYDPAMNKWKQMLDFPGNGREDAIAFSVISKGYVGTGISGTSTYYKDFYEFDPIRNSWTSKADFGGSARGGAACFSVGLNGYVGVGGTSGPSAVYQKDFWEYNTKNDTWIKKADYKGGTLFGVNGFSIGAKGYFVGGYDKSFGPTEWAYEYNPKTNVWTYIQKFTDTPRSSAICFNIGARGYYGMGSLTGVWSGDFYEYVPPQSFKWFNGDTTEYTMVNSPGYFDVSVTNSAGCTYVYSALANGTTNFPSAADTQTFNFAATVTNLSATGTNLKWYSSSIGNNALTASAPLVHNTHYYVSQTTNGCESGRKKVFVKITSPNLITDIPQAGIVLYPNPASTFLKIQTDIYIYSLEIYDLNGKRIVQLQSNDQVDIHDLATGNYYLKIITDNGVINKLFSKE